MSQIFHPRLSGKSLPEALRQVLDPLVSREGPPVATIDAPPTPDGDARQVLVLRLAPVRGRAPQLPLSSNGGSRQADLIERHLGSVALDTLPHNAGWW